MSFQILSCVTFDIIVPSTATKPKFNHTWTFAYQPQKPTLFGTTCSFLDTSSETLLRKTER